MAILRQTLTIRVADDLAVGVLSLGTMCGAVICAAIAGGVEAAGGVALLAARLRTGAGPGRYRELRFDGDGAWAVVGHDSGVTAIEPPVVHVSHRAVVVLEVVAAGMRDCLVFTPFSTAAAELRRLRVLLRSTGLSR